MPGIDKQFPSDGGYDAPTKADLPGENIKGEAQQGAATDDGKPDHARLIQLARAADSQALTFARQNWIGPWDRSYKAFRSEYIDSSKYKSADYRHRSQIFRPKTRIAVTKDMASAAASLFNTLDSVTTTAGDDSDPAQVANAELVGALINYRLDRTSGKASIPWFLTVMGARQDCAITGICASKQYWSYQEKQPSPTAAQADDEAATGDNLADGGMGKEAPEPTLIGGDIGGTDLGAEGATGIEGMEPAAEELAETPDAEQQEVRTAPAAKVLKDKPEIELIPGENVGMDPAASWLDPVNSGAYFFVRYPMHVQDVQDRMKDPRVAWIEAKDDAQIWSQARVQSFDAAEVRRAREGGTDRMDNNTSTDRAFDVVWVYEWFIRTKDEDWNFWTLGKDHMLSEPAPTEESYPWKAGERPYRIGYGNLEAHRIVPQSMVHTLQPLQQEINDITNLRLDNLKQVIQPVALVKRGKKVDTDALKRRYPVVFLDDPEKDVQWDRPPDSAASSFAETSRLDTDFDDLAGNFNGGSVSSNRQVGETVGGMRMMQGAASAVSEFYVRLFVETWVEPVLADLAKLEQYYESDEKILALARKRAPAMKMFGEDEITDEMLSQDVLVRVDAGTGSADPQAKLAKIAQGIDLTTKAMAGSKKFASGEIQMNEEALINEIWGNCGTKDGFDKFFVRGQPMPPPGQGGKVSESINFKDLPPDGQVQLAAKAGLKIAPPQGPSGNGAGETDSKMAIANVNAKAKIATALIAHKASERSQVRDHRHENKHAFVDTMMEALKPAPKPPMAPGKGGGARPF